MHVNLWKALDDMTDAIAILVKKLQKMQGGKGLFRRHLDLSWRVPNPPGANPLVAERALGGLRSLV